MVSLLCHVQQQRHLQSSYEWVGCFADNWWDGLFQSRPLDDGFESEDMTIEVCAENHPSYLRHISGCRYLLCGVHIIRSCFRSTSLKYNSQ